METRNDRTDPLNGLLRGELAAVETYRQALEKVGNEPGASELRSIEEEHRAAAATLRDHISRLGGQPSDSSGAWGTWAKTVQGAAKLFGHDSALKALKEGEEHGIKDYQSALNDPHLLPECRVLIDSQLLPQTRDHVRALDRLIAA